MKHLTPNFLQKIDHYLVVNHPHIWATQIHKLLFWGGIYAIAILIVAISYPVSIHHIPDEETFFKYCVIPPILIFLYWGYAVSLHKPIAQFADISPSFLYKEILIYAVGIFQLSVSPFLASWILLFKIQYWSQYKMLEPKIYGSFLYPPPLYEITIILMAYLLLCLMLFLRLGLKNFLFSAITSVILFVCSVLFWSFFGGFGLISIVPLCFGYVVEFVMFYSFIHSMQSTLGMRMIKNAIWSFLILSTSLSVMAICGFKMDIRSDIHFFRLIIVGFVLTYFLWVWVYNKQLMRIYSEAKQF